VVVAYRDRLCRFGFELFEWLLGKFGTKIVVLHAAEADPTERIGEDLLAIVTVFCARAHGMRSYKRALAKKLEEEEGEGAEREEKAGAAEASKSKGAEQKMCFGKGRGKKRQREKEGGEGEEASGEPTLSPFESPRQASLEARGGEEEVFGPGEKVVDINGL